MGITTGKGDSGYTLLYSGERVSKDDIRIELCGSLDELASFLGLIKSLLKSKKIKDIIESIQKEVAIIATEVSCSINSSLKVKEKINRIYIQRLEADMKCCKARLKFKKNCFSTPGKNVISGYLHVARTIARRSEREAVFMVKKKLLKNSFAQVYLNRLSDFLYILALLYEGKKAVL